MNRWCDCNWHSGLIYPNLFGLVGHHLHNNKGARLFITGGIDEVIKTKLGLEKLGWKE